MGDYQEALMCEEIEELQGEVERLKKVKATVDFFKENKYAGRRVKKTEIEKKAYPLEKMSREKLTATRQTSIRETFHQEKNRDLMSIIMVVLPGVIAVCCLGNWYEIEGYEINMFKLIIAAIDDEYGVGRLLMRDNSGGGFTGLGVGVLILCTALWFGAFLFGVICYDFYKNQVQKDAYVGLVYIAGIFVVTFCIAEFFNQRVRSSLGGYLPIRLELTNTAWITLVLAVVLCILFYQSKINGTDEQMGNGTALGKLNNKNVLTDREERLPVTVFYPWETLCFHTLSVRYGSYVSIALEYSYIGLLKNGVSEEKKNQKVEVKADIVLETNDDMYVIKDETFMIESLKEKGKTESLPFSISEFPRDSIINLEVYLKTIKSGSQEERRIAPLCIDSELVCEELARYRVQENDDEAMCKYEEFDGIFVFMKMFNRKMKA